MGSWCLLPPQTLKVFQLEIIWGGASNYISIIGIMGAYLPYIWGVFEVLLIP